MSLRQRQWRRWHLLRMVLEGRLSLREASDRMQVSYRHAKRLKGVAARDGPGGFVHGNTGRRPINAIGMELRQKILELSRTEYASFNDTHFTEKLLVVEGIRISRETLRRIRRGAGIVPKRRRRPPRHRSRRVRKPHEGMMVLWDGSAHQWFGPEHPPSCLVSAERVWGEDDLGGIEFLRWPKVGQEVTTIVSSVIETKDTMVKPREGEPFSIALSGVNYALYIEGSSKELSDRVRRLNVPTWEVVGKLKSILRKRKDAGKSLWGWTVTIKHVKEGSQGKKGQENYEVIEKD